MALIRANNNGVNDVLNSMTASKSIDIVEIAVDLLEPYHNHPFTLYEGERLEDMVDSIRENGVLTPIIVQPIANGKYEILAGHNRWNASKIVGKQTIPAIVKEGLSEETAFMYVVETNIVQRGFNNLKISEQATVIAERAEAFRDEKRKAIFEEINENEYGRIDVALGEEYELDPKRIQRLLRIHRYLIPELKVLLDDEKIQFVSALHISFLDKESQKIVSDLVENEECVMSLKKAERLKEYAKENDGKVSEDVILMIMDGKSAKENDNTEKVKSVRINKSFYDKYFPKGVKKEQIKEVTELAITEYFNNHPELLENSEENE